MGGGCSQAEDTNATGGGLSEQDTTAENDRGGGSTEKHNIGGAEASLDEAEKTRRCTAAAATAASRTKEGKIIDEKNEEGEKQSGSTDELASTNRTLRVFVSLNGTDNWRPAEGPPVVYFEPPPEPHTDAELADQANAKSKAKRKG